MDRIYGLASLVLVAAAGADALTGLVGYEASPRPTIDQISGTVQGLQLVISSPPLQYILENSKWNTRGWTFQEWHLARRALIFTDDQVYYICSSASYCEDIALENFQPHLLMSLILENCNASTMRHYLPSRYTQCTGNGGWVEYIQLVEHYSKRELTYESDTLLAISGLLNDLHRASRNRFLCRVSIGLFHDALFWVPENRAELRWGTGDTPTLLFPTWSWASAKSAVKYRVFPASGRSLIEDWAVWTDSQLGILGTPLTEPQNDRFIVGMTFFSDRPTIKDAEAEARRRGTGLLGANHLHQYILKFKAEVATLQLVGGVINDFSSRGEALLDQRGAYMGVAILDKPRSQIEKVTGDFVNVQCMAISVSKSKMPYMDEPAFTTLPEDEELVNLMLVKEMETLFCISIGLGQVSKDTWDDWANAKSREIHLA
ncbi:uncharacterized protein LY89DRAFT_266682 [Mollisia scopiformis]|uniref:Heterokaryon incompatibility domain-containing protein n=1 Tax=Mollisia scopiformis TaxID=149040 RepID=A0A132BC33_MOLSC|nr:uncharacterized protein LY89DRAFT_266682 [Mollisia scopiformis]KUJ09938.1 hypothetical protein LY89DRAFT_266682 [Mollisia scopiformis]